MLLSRILPCLLRDALKEGNSAASRCGGVRRGTLPFVRRRSLFLFTTLVARTIPPIPCSATYRRLNKHLAPSFRTNLNSPGDSVGHELGGGSTEPPISIGLGDRVREEVPRRWHSAAPSHSNPIFGDGARSLDNHL